MGIALQQITGERRVDCDIRRQRQATATRNTGSDPHGFCLWLRRSRFGVGSS